MEKDKKTMAAFFGALALIIIMLVTTIINISKIAKNFDEINEKQNANTNSSYNTSVKNEEKDDKEENLILKERNSSKLKEDDE